MLAPLLYANLPTAVHALIRGGREIVMETALIS